MPEPSAPRQIRPRTPDEWISFGRLLLAFLLWVPALLRKPRLVAGGIVLSACSDIADGLVSRMRGDRSHYARQLDTVADTAVMLSSIGWLALARPGSLAPLRRTIGAIAFIGAVLISIQCWRHRTFGALHIDSARAAAVVGHLYILSALWWAASSRILLRLFQLFVAGGAIESAWLILGPRDRLDGSPRPLLGYLKQIVSR